MVKVPEPVQLELPVNVQLPVMVLPFTLPVRARVFPEGDLETTVMPNLPLAWPLKFPASVKEPLSVSPDAKQGEFVLKLKFEMLIEPSLLTVIDVPKVKAGELPPLIRVAFHVPLTLAEFELFEPHPINVSPTTRITATARYFIKIPRVKVRRGAKC